MKENNVYLNEKIINESYEEEIKIEINFQCGVNFDGMKTSVLYAYFFW